MAGKSWTSPEQSDEIVQEYFNKIESFAQKSVNVIAGGGFQKFVVTQALTRSLCRPSEGADYIAKVDTGNGDDKFLHVQFTLSIPPFYVSFIDAEITTKDAALEPLF